MATKDIAEPRGMAKAQKSMMVPEDLYKLIADREAQTGTTFTRQAIAAFLAYFFAEPPGPNPFWMQMAIAIEKGEASVGDTLLLAAEDDFRWADAELKMWEEYAQQNPPNRDFLTAYETRRWLAKQKVLRCRNILKMDKDPIEALLAYWAKQRTPDRIQDQIEECVDDEVSDRLDDAE